MMNITMPQAYVPEGWFPLGGHLRWAQRNEQMGWTRVLQQQWQQIGTGKTEWRDVPTVIEQEARDGR